VAACGITAAGTTSSIHNATTPSPASKSIPPSISPTPTTTPSLQPSQVGESFIATDGQGNEMSITLVKVIDPAQGADSFTTPDTGKHFVGAEFQVIGKAGTYSDDAILDAALIGSNGQTYTPSFDAIAGCTDFTYGSFSIIPGETQVGCVTFQLPQGVAVDRVEWTPVGGFGGAPAIWVLSAS
jgi:hypothetical protein